MKSTCAMLMVVASATLFSSCARTKRDVARNELLKANIEYSEASFIESIKTNDARLANLFLDSGMSANSAFKGDTRTLNNILIADGDTALVIAAALGYDEIVLSLLSNGADVNPKADSGRLPLTVARGRTSQTLLEHGADINAVDKLDVTALMYASLNDDAETLKVLLDNRADMDANNSYGVTPLMNASSLGKLNAVRMLIDAGANVNARDIYGYTALRFAREEKRTEVVKALLDGGAKDLPLIKKRPSIAEVLRKTYAR